MTPVGRTNRPFPIDAVRAQFPALSDQADRPAPIFFDAPGGTQVCRGAIDHMVAHMARGTANSGGGFVTSVETDAISEQAHRAMADLLGGHPDDIAFGPNMTSLTLAVSRAISRDWARGDSIVLSRLDHDANVSPWLMAAADRGVEVRWIDFDPASGRLILDQLSGLIDGTTRLITVGAASNSLGTINDIPAIVAAARAQSRALVIVDAVQSVPHVVTDVTAMGCDLLACSPYKFFGPHQGVLWGRREVMQRISAYKVRPAADGPGARRFETGTPSFEGQAGVLGTVEYLASLAHEVAVDVPADRRSALNAAMRAIEQYEHALGTHFLNGLAAIAGVRLFGPPTMDGRVPTFALTIDGVAPADAVAALSAAGINAWAGHFYAVEPVTRLGLMDRGGLIRIGLCHYSTVGEVDRTLSVLSDIAARR